ncbi:MAG TPA: multidrug transporter AcrB [Alphaproteobacteria bacterium]|nr:multidrug transporter AcrB [Alphaproteobacteria bacterium]
MFLSDISVRRPVLASVMSLLLIVLGVMAFLRLPLRELPDIDPPVVSVETIYPGAAAAVVETNITTIIENQLAGLEGIETITSRSRDGRSDVSIEFALSRDIEAAANDVRNAVSRVIDQLPDAADPPQISKADADAQPIMFFNLSSDRMGALELTDYAERFIVDQLSAVPGVARVQIGGAQRYAMRVWINPDALAARGLTIGDIEEALRRENVEVPAGRLESRTRDFSIRLPRAYEKPEDFERLVIRTTAAGQMIRLGEVARVSRESSEVRNQFRGNGVAQIGVGVVRQSKANLLDVARAAKAEVARLGPTLPAGMKFDISSDTSIFVEAAVKEVRFTIAVAIALVIGVIFLFLGTIRAAIIPAATVPVCLVASFAALDLFGFSLNLLTLLAIVLAIGLVVDDAIVVLENIQRRIQMGEPRFVAAARGARQVAFAVLATTTVLISVFLPIAFLEGNIGRLFAELAVTLAASVAISAFVALTLTPMMCALLLRPTDGDGPISRAVHTLTDALSQSYRGALELTLAAPLAALILFGGAIVMTVAIFQVIPSELAPEEDTGGFNVNIQGPEGQSFDATLKEVLKVEAILMDYVKSGEIRRLVTRVPAGFGRTEEFNNGFAVVFLADWAERSRPMRAMIAEVTPRLQAIPGMRINVVTRQGLGQRGGGRPVQFVITGRSYEELANWRDLMLAKMAENPNLTGPDSDLRETKPQLLVRVDRDRAAAMGVSLSVLGRTLETLLGARRVTSYVEGGEDYDVILQAERQERQTPDDLSNTFVRTLNGQLVPLSNMVSIEENAGPNSLQRFNRERAVTIQAGIAPGYTLGEGLAFMDAAAAEVLPPSARTDYAGQSREFRQSTSALYVTFALALLVVYLVLAAQFESFVHPFIILMTVPLAVAGALFGLFVYGSTLNIYSQIGIVMLIGLAAKNGILIVEFANQLRDAGRPFREALIEACAIRLRPILMTSIATAMGALPLILEGGPGSASRETLGVVVFAGVVFSTLLTLFVIPVFYDLLARGSEPAGAIGREMDAWEAENPDRDQTGH